ASAWRVRAKAKANTLVMLYRIEVTSRKVKSRKAKDHTGSGLRLYDLRLYDLRREQKCSRLASSMKRAGHGRWHPCQATRSGTWRLLGSQCNKAEEAYLPWAPIRGTIPARPCGGCRCEPRNRPGAVFRDDDNPTWRTIASTRRGASNVVVGKAAGQRQRYEATIA